MKDHPFMKSLQICSEYTGLQARGYHYGQYVAYYSTQTFPKDYVNLYLDQILEVKQPVSIFFTQEELYFVITNIEEITTIVGPVSELAITKVHAEKIADLLSCNSDEREIFCRSLLSLPNTSVMTSLFMACYTYYQMTGVKLNPFEMLRNSGTPVNYAIRDKVLSEDSLYELDEALQNNETFYQFERNLLQTIKTGNMKDVKTLFQEMTLQIPPKASYHMRHYKNTFIIATTVISRAAVECGISPAQALTLSDYYVNRCELLFQTTQIVELMMQMIGDFKKLIDDQKVPAQKSELVYQVNNYVQKHITERITVNEMAEELGMSRNNLSERFKKESGVILSDFIMQQKVQRAKSLLEKTDYTLAEISSSLSFSSQSHFQRAFKNVAGITPNEYRKEHHML